MHFNPRAPRIGCALHLPQCWPCPTSGSPCRTEVPATAIHFHPLTKRRCPVAIGRRLSTFLSSVLGAAAAMPIFFLKSLLPICCRTCWIGRVRSTIESRPIMDHEPAADTNTCHIRLNSKALCSLMPGTDGTMLPSGYKHGMAWHNMASTRCSWRGRARIACSPKPACPPPATTHRLYLMDIGVPCRPMLHFHRCGRYRNRDEWQQRRRRRVARDAA